MESPRDKTVCIVALDRSRASASAVSVTVGRPPQYSSFRNNGTKQGNERSKLPTHTKVHVRGLIFSRAPKHECMHLCCMHSIRRQSIPCPPIHAPLHQLSGSQVHARQRKASCGATVNCRMSVSCSYRSTGNRLRFFIQPCIALYCSVPREP